MATTAITTPMVPAVKIKNDFKGCSSVTFMHSGGCAGVYFINISLTYFSILFPREIAVPYASTSTAPTLLRRLLFLLIEAVSTRVFMTTKAFFNAACSLIRSKLPTCTI